MRNKSAFTLIELLVVCAIIAIMTVLTIPFFSRYGSRSEFNLRTIEVKSLVEQMNNMAKNPEQSITRYLIKVDTANGNVGLYKKDDTADNLIKEINVPDYSISATDSTKKYLVCDSPGDMCCIIATATGTCSDADRVTGLSYFTLKGGNRDSAGVSDDGSATFNIKSAPFRVSY